jgi:hypothetical protein
MGLKAPGILVFLISIVLAIAALVSRFGATIPFLTGDASQFYGVLLAYLILALGCTMRGL